MQTASLTLRIDSRLADVFLVGLSIRGMCQALPLDPTGNPGFVASLRMAVEIGSWEEARFILPGGQSGNPFSPHYADQFPLWRRGEAVPIPWSEEAVRRATRQTLILEPFI